MAADGMKRMIAIGACGIHDAEAERTLERTTCAAKRHSACSWALFGNVKGEPVAAGEKDGCWISDATSRRIENARSQEAEEEVNACNHWPADVSPERRNLAKTLLNSSIDDEPMNSTLNRRNYGLCRYSCSQNRTLTIILAISTFQMWPKQCTDSELVGPKEERKPWMSVDSIPSSFKHRESLPPVMIIKFNILW